VDAGVGWAQVWDLPPIVVEKVHYLLPRRRCGGCGKTTTAALYGIVTDDAVTDGIVVDEQRQRYVSVVVEIEHLACQHARKGFLVDPDRPR